ncbi:MAG: Ltp family lipoprotein [Erysipelotrichaceae bacterium]|jgi:hypothetical protein|nr:Ltp family lipoprotein [Erysipelotrichaceae bacterium]
MIKSTGKKSGLLGKILIGLVILGVIGSLAGGGTGGSKSTPKPEDADTSVKVTVVDFSNMTTDEIEAWAKENKVEVQFTQEYSNTVEDGGFISQSKEKDSTVKQGSKIKVVYSLGEEPPTEYKNALKKAETYSDVMFMSKEGIYQQLTSEYGERFPKDAAEWAVEHLNADYNYNALKKAETYSTSMYMSKKGIYDQLVSPYGEKFTKSEAQYAVDNLEADYNKNALMKAKTYETSMSMSKDAIYDQLVSEYGEQFTADEAQYAIDHLDD